LSFQSEDEIFYRKSEIPSVSPIFSCLCSTQRKRRPAKNPNQRLCPKERQQEKGGEAIGREHVGNDNCESVYNTFEERYEN
jgi:hypothetical protein